MREETSVEYRWSTAFWLKKALWLLGMFLTGWLIWWLWGYDADTATNTDTNNNAVTIVDTDSDGVADAEDDDDDGDGYNDTVERAAGTDPLDATEYPQDTDGDGFTDEDERTAGSDMNDVDVTPDNYDADGDGYSYTDETAAASDPDDVDSTPDTVNQSSNNQAPNPNTSGVFSVNVPGFTGEPTVSSNGTSNCVYTYDYEGVSTLTIYDNCMPSTLGNTDWVWFHDADRKVTSSPTAYDCSGAELIGSSCTHGNGVLEVWSMQPSTQNALVLDADPSTDYVIFYFTDRDGTNETNAVSQLTPIIESFTLN